MVCEKNQSANLIDLREKHYPISKRNYNLGSISNKDATKKNLPFTMATFLKIDLVIFFSLRRQIIMYKIDRYVNLYNNGHCLPS